MASYYSEISRMTMDPAARRLAQICDDIVANCCHGTQLAAAAAIKALQEPPTVATNQTTVANEPINR